MRTITHMAIGGLATIAVLTGTAVTASAQSTTIKDKRADVVQYEAAEEGDNATVLNRADSIASGIDATSLTVKHGKKSLKITIRFAKLAKGPEASAFATVRVKGSKQPRYVISSLSNKKVAVYDMKNDEVKQLCTGKQTRKTGKKGTITFTVTRECLKKPKSIKVQSGASRLISFEDDHFGMYEEAISPSSVRTPKATKWLKAS